MNSWTLSVSVSSSMRHLFSNMSLLSTNGDARTFSHNYYLHSGFLFSQQQFSFPSPKSIYVIFISVSSFRVKIFNHHFWDEYFITIASKHYYFFSSFKTFSSDFKFTFLLRKTMSLMWFLFFIFCLFRVLLSHPQFFFTSTNSFFPSSFIQCYMLITYSSTLCMI